MKSSKFLAFFTALVLIFALCACSANEPSGHSDKGKDKLSSVSIGNTESQEFSADAGTSIDVLREEIGQSTAQFGIAYVGYFDAETAEETGIDFAQWFYANSSGIAAYYPFISEIDEAHTVGSEGHLYCVIAKDYDSSISVSRIGDDKPLYRAENGDPILVFGNERELLSWDFTATGDEGFDLEAWLSDGWLGVAVGSLAGIGDGIDWWISTWDGSVRYCLTFNSIKSGSYDGEVVLECFYADGSTVQAQWQGWWRVETELDQPSRLYIDMMLYNGADMDAFSSCSLISESYRALIHPSGDYILLVADDDASTINPIFPDGVQAVELSQSVG